MSASERLEATAAENRDAVVWTKIVLTGLPEMCCQIDVTKDGRTLDRDGEPIPHDRRPFKCGADGRWMVGSVFLCEQHAREVAHLMEDDLDEIDAAWREKCL